MNLVSLISRSSRSEHALITDEPLSYSDLHRRIDAVRAAVCTQLAGRDRVVVIGRAGVAFVSSVLGIVSAGAAVLPLDPRNPVPELQHAVDLVRPSIVVVCDDESVDGLDLAGATLIRSADLASSGAAATPVPPLDCADDRPAFLLLTTGTSAAPRVAVLSHGNVIASVRQTVAGAPSLDDESHVVLGVVPFAHVLGLVSVLLVSLHVGGSLVAPTSLSPAHLLELVRTHKPSLLVAPPVFWYRLAEAGLDRSELASVRLAVSGAAPLTGSVAKAIQEQYGLQIRQGYGLTEASPALTSAIDTDVPANSVGWPLPGVEIRLVDEFGDDVLVGDVGEIWARGDNVFSGYFEDPEATARVLDDDRWLHTGDLAVVDEAGSLFIVGRNSDLIIVSGFNVHPAQVESVLISHPAVAEAAVVAEADRELGERVVATVVAADGASIDVDDLHRWCTERLAAYKRPARISVEESLPRASSGKLLRRRLRN